MIRKLKKIEPQTVRLPSRHTIDNEFADHCATLGLSLCSECGEPAQQIEGDPRNGVCTNDKCDKRTPIVPLAPTLEEIYGADGNAILEGGTGEMRSGHMSASGKRWEIFKKRPTGCGIHSASPIGIRIIATDSLPGLPKDSAW